MQLWCMLADADPSGLAGSSGWFGAGLLGLILAWLLFIHLPHQAKTTKEFSEEQTKRLDAISTQHSAVLKEMVLTHAAFVRELIDRADKIHTIQAANFKEALDKVLLHCQREGEFTIAKIETTLSEISNVIIDLRRAIEDLRSPPTTRH